MIAMIIDDLKNLKKFDQMNPRFPEAFAFLEKLIAENAPDGHHVMQGTDIPEAIYVNICSGVNQPKSMPAAESHRIYIDVQVLLDGEEAMYVPVETPEVSTPYNADQDCERYAPVPAGICHCLRMAKGRFVIFFPGELHAPSCGAGNMPSASRKAIIKVLA